jgi:hypothetical protein
MFHVLLHLSNFMSFGLNMCIIENDFGFIDFIGVVDCGVLQNAS